MKCLDMYFASRLCNTIREAIKLFKFLQQFLGAFFMHFRFSILGYFAKFSTGNDLIGKGE